MRWCQSEAWGERHRFQFLDKLVESEDAGFFGAIHAATDFEVDAAVAGDGNGISVVVPDFFQNDGWSDAYVLEV